MNQAKRIVEKFDEILYGSAPEVLVNQTHTTIRALLTSPECRSFIDGATSANEEPAAAGDEFVRKIIVAVSPILPVALRNKSLDGAYLRTALYVLGAAEILFAQYEEDARVQANPAGAVGLCQAMHSEIERATLYGNQKLKPPREFYTEMKTQYQTSLGLGKSFSKDTSRGRRRSRRGRGQFQFRGGNQYLRGQAFTRGRMTTQTYEGIAPTGGTGPYTQENAGTNTGYVTQPTPIRGRNVCFNFQSGTCQRGRSCRFLHVNQ